MATTATVVFRLYQSKPANDIMIVVITTYTAISPDSPRATERVMDLASASPRYAATGRAVIISMTDAAIRHIKNEKMIIETKGS